MELVQLLNNKIESSKSERFYQKGHFYKIAIDSDIYSVTKYLPASCASYYNAPNIKFKLIDSGVQLVSYLDNSESPTVSITFNAVNDEKYQEKLEELQMIINQLLQIDYFKSR